MRFNLFPRAFICRFLARHFPQDLLAISGSSETVRRSQTLLDARLYRRRISTKSIFSNRDIEEAVGASQTFSIPKRLPWTCPGCGAYSQTHTDGEAGFYHLARKSVLTYVNKQPNRLKSLEDSEKEIMHKALKQAGENMLMSTETPLPDTVESDRHNTPPIPLCDRCHTLLHYHRGQPSPQPTLQSIAAMLLDSPYKRNHVYHVLDAADFPLSLIPQLHRFLPLTPLRSRNRRSRAALYSRGRKFDLSFIITRSDLLSPRKEQVDAMMPHLLEILRDAIHGLGHDFRLGNVYCISSTRGWWTRKLKEDIWNRGGCGWMIGKVNVGKSSLFEVAFPKGGSLNRVGGSDKRHNDSGGSGLAEDYGTACVGSINLGGGGLASPFSSSCDLVPPHSDENPYPTMPTVSHIPGTTASPIRLPFGQGRGELVDFPGLERDTLDKFVLEERRSSLVMRYRVSAKQYSIKPGQSLILSNIIRITPKFDDSVLLACPFVPLYCHVASTEKAEAILAQKATIAFNGIAKPGVEGTIASAGIYHLKWEATKLRAGPLTSSDAIKLDPDVLPFIVYSADLLIEGIGWIELAVQRRKREIEKQDTVDSFPTVEVHSPMGKCIGLRRPLHAWIQGGRKRKPVSRRKSRPRQSKKGEKKRMKQERRRLQQDIRARSLSLSES